MREEMAMMGLPRPGKVLLWVIGVLLAIWLFFAVSVNWANVDGEAFTFLAGNTDKILHFQVWRLVTAGLLHHPRSINHILFALLGLYFLGPTLESRWGGRRFLFFLIASSTTAFALQFAAEALLPESIASKIGQEYWFGSMGAVEAIAIAWAVSNRAQTVRLFFVLPVTGNGLILFVIGVSLLMVITRSQTYEGLITPFGGMLAGYLFGADTPSPARRFFLRVRYLWIARRAARYRRTTGPKLRVIEGGESREARRKPPSDKRFLN
jgi:membrane associated rhomboid family serine protease